MNKLLHSALLLQQKKINIKGQQNLESFTFENDELSGVEGNCEGKYRASKKILPFAVIILIIEAYNLSEKVCCCRLERIYAVTAHRRTRTRVIRSPVRLDL